MRIVRKALVALASLCAAFGWLDAAIASPGCDAISITPLGVTTPGTGFVRGDTITLNLTNNSGNSFMSLIDGTAFAVLAGPTTTAFTYVVPADTSDALHFGGTLNPGDSVAGLCVNAPAPTVSSVSPNTGAALGGTSVVITGTGFTFATAVAFGSSAATSFTVNSGTQITAVVPAHAAGAVDVVVTNNVGSSTLSAGFTYTNASTSVTLTSSPNPSQSGQAVAFSASVASSGGSPSGTMTFSDGGVVFGTVALSGGVATLTTASLSVGTHNITATYNAGPGFSGSASAALAQMVNVPADSSKLRSMQIVATRTVAQISGQAISGAIDGAIADGFSDNPSPVMSNGDGMRFNFAAADDDGGRQGPFGAMRSPTNDRVDHAFSALAYAGSARPVTKASPRVAQRDWQAWIDVRGGGIRNNSGTADDLSGGQINVTAGLTRRLTPDVLIGMLVGYENFRYDSAFLTARLRGDGWTGGAYLGWRFWNRLRLDVAVAYTGLDYSLTAGTAAASLPGRRVLVSAGLTGNYRLADVDLEPSARLYALWEHQDGYTDSLGTAQTDRNFSSGRASTGLKAARSWMIGSDLTLAPYVGIYADYYFSKDGTDTSGLSAIATVPLVVLQSWSTRVTSGAAMTFAGGPRVSIGGEVGGLGRDYTLWSAKAQAAFPF
jgi:outer membrane autotransporter protein